MKKISCLFFLFFCMLSFQVQANMPVQANAPVQVNVSVPASTYEMRAVWISYLEINSLLKDLDKNSFERKTVEMFDNISELGLNTVIVQVRPFSDAIYPSSYFPWSKYIGTPNYDPFALMVNKAKEKGLSIHAWINPYRIGPDIIGPARQWVNNEQYIVSVNNSWYYNPAVPAVRELILAGIKEVLENYQVDGIHFDDYFYPTTDTSFDDIIYAASKTSMTLADWRRENVNILIRDAYQLIKNHDPGISFGISPGGNLKLNFNNLYADAAKWGREPGYVDYLAPQLYYGYQNQTFPFLAVLKEWNEIGDTDLYIGLAAYKIGLDDRWAGDGRNEWLEKSDILARQVLDSRANSNSKGFIFFSYNSLFSPSNPAEITKLRELLAEIAIVINGNTIRYDIAPQFMKGRVLVPFRGIFESLGAQVDWHEGQITAYKDDVTINLELYNKIMLVNGRKIELDVEPIIINSRTLVPIRAVSEALKAKVEWKANPPQVDITLYVNFPKTGKRS